MTCTMRYLSVNGREVKSPVFLASMAGITDVAYVNARAEYIGGAFIGGYNIDTPTRIASMEMNAGGRREFSENLDDIKSELETLCDKNVVLGVNLRGISPDSYLTAAECLGKDIIIEIDAHCRQIPMMQAGAGETLLSDIPRLTSIVSTLHANGFCVSVKWRAGIIDDANLATVLWKAGTDILHLDCMDFGSEKVREIRNACPLTIIGNNGVISADVMTNYFAHGADLVSIARHADIPHLAQLFGYAETLADEIGWYNAPKQICRGGDVRGLAFCCMPMKQMVELYIKVFPYMAINIIL